MENRMPKWDDQLETTPSKIYAEWSPESKPASPNRQLAFAQIL
jgi:hypothetical protein